MNDMTIEEAIKLANSMTTEEVAGTYFIEQLPEDYNTMIRIEIAVHPTDTDRVYITVIRDCCEAGDNVMDIPTTWTPYCAMKWLEHWLKKNKRCVDDFQAC